MAKKNKMKVWTVKIVRTITQCKELVLAGAEKHIVQEKCKLLAKKIDWPALPLEDEMISIVGGWLNYVAPMTLRKRVGRRK